MIEPDAEFLAISKNEEFVPIKTSDLEQCHQILTEWYCSKINFIYRNSEHSCEFALYKLNYQAAKINCRTKIKPGLPKVIEMDQNKYQLYNPHLTKG